MAKTRLKTVKQKIKDSKASQSLGDENLELCKVVDHIPVKAINKLNKKDAWKYGYDSEHDVVVISKTGKIGEVVEIQNLKIALPLQPENIHQRSAKKEDQYWEPFEYPKELSKIKTVFQWNEYPNAFKESWLSYIEDEFDRRENGFWYQNNGIPTYITGSHYMYLQWTKIDVGHPEYRESNRIFFIFWEACKADNRCYGMCYLKNRRSGFSFMSSAETVNQATITPDARFGMLSKTGADAKKMFTDKVVPISTNYPFFFKPIQDGMDRPKTELAYRVPASKLTRKSIEQHDRDDLTGLDTTIDWKNTGDNSYDGEKLRLLVHDECYHVSTNILNHNMDFVPIQQLNVGDKVMVEGGKIKTIVKKTEGKTQGYLIKQPYGEDYLVTENHRLVLNQYKKGEVILTAKDYFNSSKYRKQHLTRIVSKGIQSDDVFDGMPPYLLGLWLGDGRKSSMSFIVNQDEEPEILQYLGRICEMRGIDFKLKRREECKAHVVDFKMLGVNHELRKIGVYKNKHIPESYLKSSIETRLQILAGIIDTDGHSNKKKGTIEIGMSRKGLVEQIRFLALSVGLSCSNLRHKKSNFNTDVYRISISGELSRIPILTSKKSFEDYSPKTRGRRNKVSIEDAGLIDYVGIQVDAENDDERKLVLSDFTISMNSGKWEKPDNILNNWRVTKTTLRLGRRIIGKCLMGSTSNALDKGGSNFKRLYNDSDVTQRNANGQTKSGMYSLFIPMEWNFEGFLDQYGQPVFRKPNDVVFDAYGDVIDGGVLDYWENEVESLRNDSDALNEFYRQFPRTEGHAFRDEAKNSLFNLTRIYEQIDFNDGLQRQRVVQRGSFHWKDGKKDTEVIWTPEKHGRFYVSWIPPLELRNRVINKNGARYPGNEHIGAFGCDSYDISGTVGGGGSNGALHGYTKLNFDGPSNMFFLEYIYRPQTAELFYEDVLMAMVFYGMPVLAENNKPRLLYHLKNRGYRRWSINRPDKHKNDLSKAERELGGIPSSPSVISIHAEAIESYIENNVGFGEEGTGNMYFTRTLLDWANYDINKRTKFDATVSSGLALMANQKYVVEAKRKNTEINVNFARYNNGGIVSSIIK